MYDGKTLMRLNACSSVEETVSQLTEAGCYILDEPRVEQLGCTDAEVVCSGDAAGLEKAGVAKILSTDAGAFWRGESGVTHAFTEGMGVASDFYSDWRDLATIEAKVKSLVDASSSGATHEVAGKSLQGRDMNIVRLRGRGYSPDKNMTRLVLTFNLHAREWITAMAGVYAVEKLIAKVQETPGYLDGVEVVLMPMANPDGFKHTEGFARFHRKNTNTNNSLCLGTDLNRNFPTGWDTCSSLQCGSSVPCLDTFKGREAGGEPETKVIMGLLNESPMTVMIDVHSFTQLVLASWGWTEEPHPREAEFTALGTKMTDAIAARHDTTWRFGTAPQILYKAVGTLTDYATSLGALGYCFELRPESKAWSLLGFAPPASYILPSAEECFDGMLVAIEHAKAA